MFLKMYTWLFMLMSIDMLLCSKLLTFVISEKEYINGESNERAFNPSSILLNLLPFLIQSSHRIFTKLHHLMKINSNCIN